MTFQLYDFFTDAPEDAAVNISHMDCNKLVISDEATGFETRYLIMKMYCVFFANANAKQAAIDMSCPSLHLNFPNVDTFHNVGPISRKELLERMRETK